MSKLATFCFFLIMIACLGFLLASILWNGAIAMVSLVILIAAVLIGNL